MLLTMAVGAWAEPGDVITDINDLSSDRAYNIETVRGRLVAGQNKLESLHADDEGYNDINADNQRFYILYNELEDGSHGYYLWSVSQKKFVNRDGNYSESPVLLDIQDKLGAGDAATDFYRWYFIWDNEHIMNNNNNGNGAESIVVNGYQPVDPGNVNMITEAESKIDDDVPSASSTVNIEFHLSYDGVERLVVNGLGFKGSPVGAPVEFQSPLIALSEPKDADGNIITEIPRRSADELIVYYEGTWGAGFEVSTSYADAHWYNMDIRRAQAEDGKFFYVSYTANPPYPCKTIENDEVLAMPAYQWAVIGNPFDGVKLINRAAGDGYYLGADAAMQQEEYVWDVLGVVQDNMPTAIALSRPGTNDCINQVGGTDGSLGIWANGNPRDNGSMLRFTDAPASEKELTKVTFNAIYNGQTVKTSTIDAFVGEPLSSIQLPAELDNGLVSFDYDDSQIITANAVINLDVLFKLDIALDKSQWYNLDIRTSHWVNTLPVDGQAYYSPISKGYESADALNTAPFQWAFEGTPYEVRVYNRAYGDQTLARAEDPNTGKEEALMQEGQYTWNIFAIGDDFDLGFGLEAADKPGTIINQEGGEGNGRILGFWTSRTDGGSKFRAYQVEQVASPDFQIVDVTYHLSFDGQEVATHVAKALPETFVAMPASFMNNLTILSEAADANGQAIDMIPAASSIDIYYTAEWNGFFSLAKSFTDANAKWYNIDIRRDATIENTGGKFLYIGRSETAPYACAPVDDEAVLSTPDYLWAFGGNPFTGIKVYNLGAGNGYTLAVNADNQPELLEGDYAWDIITIEDNGELPAGIALKMRGTNNWVNQGGGWQGTLGIWNNGSGTDPGSVIRLTEYTGEINGIASVNSTSAKPFAVYNLNGIRLQQPVRGLNIIRSDDGLRKVIIK